MRPLVAIISGMLLASPVQAEEFQPRCPPPKVQCEDFSYSKDSEKFRYFLKVRDGEKLADLVTSLKRHQPEVTLEKLAEENGLLIAEEDHEHTSGKFKYQEPEVGSVVTYTYEYH